MMRIERKQVIRILIPSPGALVRIDGDTDKTYDFLNAVQLSTREPEHTFGSELSLEVGGWDVLEEGTGAELLACNVSVAPSQRVYPFLHSYPAGGNSFELRFRDGGHFSTYPQELKLYLLLSKHERKLPSEYIVGSPS